MVSIDHLYPSLKQAFFITDTTPPRTQLHRLLSFLIHKSRRVLQIHRLRKRANRRVLPATLVQSARLCQNLMLSFETRLGVWPWARGRAGASRIEPVSDDPRFMNRVAKSLDLLACPNGKHRGSLVSSFSGSRFSMSVPTAGVFRVLTLLTQVRELQILPAPSGDLWLNCRALGEWASLSNIQLPI